jgi:hypothetical protein
VPKSFAVPAHDLELCDRALVPVLDFAQDRFQILSDRAFGLGGVGDSDPVRAHVIDEVCPSADRSWWASIETDFVPAHLLLFLLQKAYMKEDAKYASGKPPVYKQVSNNAHRYVSV